MTKIGWYLIGANVLGLVIQLVLNKKNKDREENGLNWTVLILSVLGGALGVLIGLFAAGKQAVKKTVMNKVVAVCFLLMQILLVITLKGPNAQSLSFNFIAFFKAHTGLLIYLAIVNVVAFVMYGIDKGLAKKNTQRIPIMTLLGVAFLGGGIGALLSMLVFRHKTKKDYFTVGVPLMIVLHAVVVFFLMNR